jgi:hypothetical protein
MKRLIGVILCFSVLMIACNKNKTVDEIVNDKNDQVLTETNTQKGFPKTMYVNAADGLQVRNSPSSDGESLGLLSYLTEVAITKEDNNTVNIGGIDGKWVYITFPVEGWVFNGFLDNYTQYIRRIVTTKTETNQKEQIKEKLIGAWKIINVYSDSDENKWSLGAAGVMEFMDVRISYDYGQEFFPEFFPLAYYDFKFSYFTGQLDWELGKNTIKIKGGWPLETAGIGLDAFGEYYLTDINFIDNDHIMLCNEVIHPSYDEKKVFLKLERIK